MQQCAWLLPCMRTSGVQVQACTQHPVWVHKPTVGTGPLCIRNRRWGTAALQAAVWRKAGQSVLVLPHQGQSGRHTTHVMCSLPRWRGRTSTSGCRAGWCQCRQLASATSARLYCRLQLVRKQFGGLRTWEVFGVPILCALST